jgi:hypothetical protein
MDDDRLARIRRAYVEADEKEDVTSESVLTAVHRAVPDATREEMSVILKEHIRQLGKEAEFALRLSELFEDDPGLVADFLEGKGKVSKN